MARELIQIAGHLGLVAPSRRDPPVEFLWKVSDVGGAGPLRVEPAGDIRVEGDGASMVPRAREEPVDRPRDAIADEISVDLDARGRQRRGRVNAAPLGRDGELRNRRLDLIWTEDEARKTSEERLGWLGRLGRPRRSGGLRRGGQDLDGSACPGVFRSAAAGLPGCDGRVVSAVQRVDLLTQLLQGEISWSRSYSTGRGPIRS